MAYTKTNWVDNTTPIDSTNLNKIEQGIYNNSLVADAVNSTVKPSESALTNATEITEGQITEVLGVSDIKLKGDTVQDGTPTPDSPVDVNVVSGSNVIYINDRNLLNVEPNNSNGIYTTINPDKSITYSGTISNTWSNITKSKNLSLPAGTYTFSIDKTLSYQIRLRGIYSDNTYTEIFIGAGGTYAQGTFTQKVVSYYIYIIGLTDGTTINETLKMQLEQGTTATSYTNLRKEFDLDLPIENLFNSTPTSQSNVTYQNNIITFSSISSGTQYIVFPTNNNIEGKTYTVSFDAVSTIDNATFTFDGQPDNATSTTEYFKDSIFVINTTKKRFSVTGIIPNGLTGFRFFRTTSNVSPSATITISNIQIEKGSKANVYTPYGTTPIELCKIGNYQDYFYKDNSKWYLHKEINKKTLDGTENWEYQNSHRFIIRGEVFNEQNKPILASSNSAKTGILSTHSNEITPNETYSQTAGSEGISYLSTSEEGIAISCNSITTIIADFKTWLANNLPSVYYILKTASNIEITNTTLINQLEAIGNAPLYEQTNITQTNNDLQIVLDIKAFKDNINGIKAWIRR